VPLYEMHENQTKGCAAELKVTDWQINARTSWTCDTVEGGEVWRMTGM